MRKPRINDQQRRIFRIAAGGLLILYAWAMVPLESDGVRRWMSLDSLRERLEDENEALAENNHQSRLRIDRLKRDPALIESIARSQLGLARPDEISIDWTDASNPSDRKN